MPTPASSLTELRRFYLALSVLLAVLSTIGFWPQYFQPVLAGTVETKTIIHIHAAVYASWLALFVLQCFFVASGRIALHRKIGRFGLFWGCVVIAVGLLTAILQFAEELEIGGYEAVRNYPVAPVADMVFFSTFFGAAAWYRNKPELHRRLMIVAASSILIPSIARFANHVGVDDLPARILILGLWLSPVALAAGYDLIRHRIIHPVYVIGGFLIAASNWRSPLKNTGAWEAFTRWLASVVG